MKKGLRINMTDYIIYFQNGSYTEDDEEEEETNEIVYYPQSSFNDLSDSTK